MWTTCSIKSAKSNLNFLNNYCIILKQCHITKLIVCGTSQEVQCVCWQYFRVNSKKRLDSLPVLFLPGDFGEFLGSPFPEREISKKWIFLLTFSFEEGHESRNQFVFLLVMTKAAITSKSPSVYPVFSVSCNLEKKNLHNWQTLIGPKQREVFFQ